MSGATGDEIAERVVGLLRLSSIEPDQIEALCVSSVVPPLGGQYEAMSWWDFLEGDHYSPKFQRQLRAVPRTMVAMDPKRGSARTVGTISMQLILDYASTGVTNDRTMGGPTTEMWIDPWIAHLQARSHGRSPI